MAKNPFEHLISKSAPATQAAPTSPETSPLTSLLTAQPTEPVVASGEIRADSNYELAAINTDSMEPTKEIISTFNKQVKRRNDALILDSGESVRELCDRVDSLLESNNQLAGPPLIELRSHVQQLMVTLKERPEFDGVMIDKDTRNIMKFIRATREEALLLRDIKTDKKTKRSATREVNVEKNKGITAAFAAVMGKALVKK